MVERTYGHHVGTALDVAGASSILEPEGDLALLGAFAIVLRIGAPAEQVPA